MQKLLLSICVVLLSIGAFAQCDELFISGYVEGYGNNRALEIYNPTNAAIDLSAYSVGRFSNGDAAPNLFEGIQLPADMIDPYDTYTVVLDKRDSLGSGFETPVWNGYQLYDVLIDQVTGEPVLNNDGDTIYSVQYNDEGLHLYGNVYREFLDLQGKADVFLCPVYDINNAMYFNGNDAVCLIKGTEVALDGSNVLDVVGVIGEDPGDTWQTAGGQWITRDKSLTRAFDVEGGNGGVYAALGDTLAYANWEISFKNDFSGVGNHECVCADAVSTQELNEVDFKMFPNPNNTEVLTIIADENIQTVNLTNLLGQTVLTNHSTTFGKQAQIGLNSLTPGIYTVAIEFTDEKVSIQKLIVE